MNHAMEEAKIIKGFNEKEIATYLILREIPSIENVVGIVKQISALDKPTNYVTVNTTPRPRGRPRKDATAPPVSDRYVKVGKKTRIRKLMFNTWSKLPKSISEDKGKFTDFFMDTPFNLKTWNNFLKENEIEMSGDENFEMFKVINERIGNQKV